MADSKLLKSALAYATMGWPVFPLRGKFPFPGSDKSTVCRKCSRSHASGFKDATKDPDTIREWWANHADANIGVPTGHASGFWVLDVDVQHDGPHSLRELEDEHGKLPDTVQSITGQGGTHLLFRANGRCPHNSESKIAHGIDARGEGGYIVVPPSVHPKTRKVYEWEVSSRPGEIPFADAPGWLLSAALGKDDEKPATKAKKSKTAEEIPEGERDGTLFRIACRFRREGDDYDRIYQRLQVVNSTRCNPPMPDDVVAAKARQACKFPAGYTFRLGDDVEVSRRAVTILQGGGPPLVYDEGALHQYDATMGQWGQIEPARLSCTVQDFSGLPVRVSLEEDETKPLKISARMVAGAITLTHDSCAKPGWFASARPGVAFRNGFVRVDASGAHLEPHSPEHRCRFTLPYDYTPDTRPPRWKRYWEEVFLGDQDGPSKERTIREFVGLCLIGRATTYQRALVLYGETARNGKSQAVQVIQALFPRCAVASIPPQKFSREEYVAQLAGVRLNATTEMPEGDLLDSSALKAVISGDPVPARPLYRNPFTLEPRAGHIFAANSLPTPNDMTRGFWRRFVIIGFNRQFTDDDDEKGLADKIVADPEEMAGVASWALSGAVSALANGDLSLPPSHADALSEWREHADQVVQFLLSESTYPEKSPASLETLAEVHRRYLLWADRTKHRSMADNQLGKRLGLLGLKTRYNNVRYYSVTWKHVETKKDEDGEW